MKIGDKVMLPGRMPGVIVGIIDNSENSKEHWSGLESALIIEIEGPDFGRALAEPEQLTAIEEPKSK